MDIVRNPVPIGATPAIPVIPATTHLPPLPVLSMDPIDVKSLPEMERFSVELKKDTYGLGITIAGYVCEKGKKFLQRLNCRILVEEQKRKLIN